MARGRVRSHSPIGMVGREWREAVGAACSALCGGRVGERSVSQAVEHQLAVDLPFPARQTGGHAEPPAADVYRPDSDTAVCVG
eukprot:ctg_1028.g428